MANIYKLEIGDDFYIGSTCNLTQRLINHKSITYNENDRRYEQSFYSKIRDITWDNVKCVILETCDKELRYEREQYFIDKLEPTLNLFRVIKDNDYYKKWDIKVDCECGSKYSKSHKTRHLKTEKHIKFINSK